MAKEVILAVYLACRHTDKILAAHTIETIKRFVSIGMGISIVPRLCIAKEIEEGSLKALSIRDARFQRKLGLIYNKDRYQSQAARAFLALITAKQQAGAKEKRKS